MCDSCVRGVRVRSGACCWRVGRQGGWMTLHKVSICYGMYKWGRAPRRRYHCMAVSLRGPAVAAGRPRAGGAAGARRDRVREAWRRGASPWRVLELRRRYRPQGTVAVHVSERCLFTIRKYVMPRTHSSSSSTAVSFSGFHQSHLRSASSFHRTPSRASSSQRAQSIRIFGGRWPSRSRCRQ